MNTHYIVPLLIFFFLSSTLADNIVPSTTPLLPENVCNPTIDPKYCKSVLPRVGRHSIYDFCRSSLDQSLRSAWRFSAQIDRYLKSRSSLSTSAIKALEDCKLLAGLNIDFLQSASSTINATRSLGTGQTDYLQSMLSAILTNHQTCLDGIQDTSSSWIIKNGISTPLNNGSKLYSVSLALFSRGWGDKLVNKKFGRVRKLMFSDRETGRHGRLPFRMSKQHREIYESVSGRKLLQDSDSVLVNDVVVVNPDGTGNFTTINDAIVAAPNNTDINNGYFVIYVVAGVYEEYVTIDKKKKNIMMIGDGINQTVITGNRNVVDGSTTFNSATLAVVGQGFVAVNITVRNTAGAIKHQAVAVRNGADLSTFYSCSFEGYQDTLYTHSMRQLYRECDIYGTVDFIFGNAAVVFQDCNIYARLPMSGQFNALTAQGRTDPNQNTGTSIHNCNIRAAPDLAASTGTTKTYLGRPWKEYSRTVYIQSDIDAVIDPAGWREWSGDFALSTLYYGEYNNRGAGSSTANRVTWPGYQVMNAVDANNFTVSNFVLGDSWVPATGVPYNAGL
ncbi:pectinesterase [Ranunculus cassubicifolius]